MQEISTISPLWAEGRLPIRDGLYTSTGHAYSVQITSAAPGGITVSDEFDLDIFLDSEPDWLTSIETTNETEINDNQGKLCCGEGSYGSEGFFARVDTHYNLVWVVYLQRSNPFVAIAIHDTHATFTSSSGVSITVDIDRPESRITGTD